MIHDDVRKIVIKILDYIMNKSIYWLKNNEIKYMKNRFKNCILKYIKVRKRSSLNILPISNNLLVY